MSPHFLTRGVSRLLGLAQVSIAFSGFALHISLLFHSLFTCHWISFVFLLYNRRRLSAPIRSTFHLLMVSFQAWDHGSGTRCCSPRGGAWGGHEAEISFQISAMAGV